MRGKVRKKTYNPSKYKITRRHLDFTHNFLQSLTPCVTTLPSYQHTVITMMSPMMAGLDDQAGLKVTTASIYLKQAQYSH